MTSIPKSEMRTPKEARSPNSENLGRQPPGRFSPGRGADIRASVFGLLSVFGFRVSDFRWALLVPLLFLTTLVAPLPAQEATVSHSVQDAGGRRASSELYRLDPSLGGFGGMTHSSSVDLRVGFCGQLNDHPVPGPNLLPRRASESAKMLLVDLLANDTDLEGDPITFLAVDAFSAAGVKVSIEGPWLIYESGSSLLEDRFTYTIADTFGGVAAGTVTVAVAPLPDDPTLNILAIEELPGGESVRIVFVGIPGRTYQIEASPTLSPAQWQFIGAGTAGANGLYSVIDAEASSHSTRFYRALQP